jgi:hypothetical protein
MKIGRKMSLVLAAGFVGGMCASMMISCATRGQFMPLSSGETVLGTVQVSFTARNTLNGKDAINTQAYIKLLEAAGSKFGQNAQIDIRDIVWVSGKDLDNQNKEYAATGKVVQIP